MMRRMLASVLWVICVSGCSVPIGGWPKYPEEFEMPQVRVFRDCEVLSDGKVAERGRIYGMKVLEDGSEEVVWGRTIDTNGATFEVGVQRLNGGTIQVTDSATVPLHVWELDLLTGECIKYGDFVAMCEQRTGENTRWHPFVACERPAQPLKPGSSYCERAAPEEISRWPDMNWKLVKIDDVQIRAFLDKGVILPNRTIGEVLQMYGMKVLPDGSERVVWRKMLDSFPAGSQPHFRMPKILHPDSNTLYLQYQDKVFKLDRTTGKTLAHFKPDDPSDADASILREWLKTYAWSCAPLHVRPAPRW